MGGRVKRSNGYNVDDFVASSEEDVSVTDESPSSGSDSDDSEFEVKANTKAKPKSTIKREPTLEASSDEADTPPPEPRTSSRRAKKHTCIFGDAAEGNELDELIGAETDEGIVVSDISSFRGSSESESEHSTVSAREKSKKQYKNDPKKSSTAKTSEKAATPARTSARSKPTTPEPKAKAKREPGAAATLPTPDTSPEALKRKRNSNALIVQNDSDDNDDEISVFRSSKKGKSEGNSWLNTVGTKQANTKAQGTDVSEKSNAKSDNSMAAKGKSFLSTLSQQFGMSARRGAEVGAAGVDQGVKIDQDERLMKYPKEEEAAYPSVGEGYGGGYVDECL